MSAIPCPKCGVLRKVEQVVSADGWHQPECWNCGDPGWISPHDAEDPLEGRVEPEVRPRRGAVGGAPVRFEPVEGRAGVFHPVDEVTGEPVTMEPGTPVEVDVLGPGQSVTLPITTGPDVGGPWYAPDEST